MAVKAKITLKGDKKLIRTLKKRTGVAFQRVSAVQDSIASEIERDSNDKVPKDTRALERSSDVKVEQSRKTVRTVAITYDEDYAIQVHEDLQAKHNPGEEAKFLEKPAKRQRRRYAVELRQAMKGGME